MKVDSLKRQRLHDSNYTPGKDKVMQRVRRAVVARGWGKGEMSGQSTEDVEGSETILYESMMADTCHYTFVNTCGMYNTKSEL